MFIPGMDVVLAFTSAADVAMALPATTNSRLFDLDAFLGWR